MKIAVFDFDGTITSKDSLIDFIQYTVGKSVYYMGLVKLSPILAAYTLKLIPNHIAKENLIAHFFKGWPEDEFRSVAARYSLERLSGIVRSKAVGKIRWHQEHGHKVVVVSASMECWLKGWCENIQVDLIATQLEIKHSRLTGKFATKNCYGMEKVNRIKEIYDLSRYEYVYAYGDSCGDKELLALADEKFYKPFRD